MNSGLLRGFLASRLSFLPATSGGLLVRDVTAARTMRPTIAIDRDQFRRPATRAKTEAQLVGERPLCHAQIAFCFIKKIPNIHRRVSVGRKIFARGPKLVGYEADGKEGRMKSINVHVPHLHGQSYKLIAIMCQFCEFNAGREVGGRYPNKS
jgi:hypothetical protein